MNDSEQRSEMGQMRPRLNQTLEGVFSLFLTLKAADTCLRITADEEDTIVTELYLNHTLDMFVHAMY